MRKVYRPLWSYDVRKTEKWLSQMAKQGYHLVELNRWTRCFLFQEGEPREVTYQIAYDKAQSNTLPTTLSNEGWEKVSKSGNWSFLCNEKPVEGIKIFSTREGIVKRNTFIKYVHSGILTYLLFQVIIFLGLVSLTIFGDVQVEVEPSPLWILTYLYFGTEFVLLILASYSVFKINQTNAQLNTPNGGVDSNGSDQSKQVGEVIVKRKFGWIYGPDKLECWLEEMEEKGFNLNRVSKSGISFYFTKGISRKVSYCAEYRRNDDKSYFDIHQDAGWKNAYTSNRYLQKWTIWSCEYRDGERKPQFYSGELEHMKQVKIVATKIMMILLPLLILYTCIIFQGLIQPYHESSIIYGVLIVLLGSLIFRVWMYYERTKKLYVKE